MRAANPPPTPKKLPNFFARNPFCGLGGVGLLSEVLDGCLDIDGEASGVSGKETAPPGNTLVKVLL